MKTETDAARPVRRDAEEIEALVRSFERCEVTREEWTHAAHVLVAFWYATHHPLEEATRRMREGILRLNTANGVANTPTSGYHETITVCWMRIVAAFAAARRGEAIAESAGALVAHATADLPLRYYRKETLMSPAARAAWVPPDLAPLP